MGAIRFTAGVESISTHEARVISTAAPGWMLCHALARINQAQLAERSTS